MPIAFVSRIVLHWGLPLTIFLIIPVIGLLGLLVDPLLISPIVWLLVLGVVHHAIVDPIRRLFVVGVRDLLRRQEFPIFLQRALVDLLCVDLNPDRVVRLHDQSVKMGGAIRLLLVSQIRLLQDILALVAEDQVRP